MPTVEITNIGRALHTVHDVEGQKVHIAPGRSAKVELHDKLAKKYEAMAAAPNARIRLGGKLIMGRQQQQPRAKLER